MKFQLTIRYALEKTVTNASLYIFKIKRKIGGKLKNRNNILFHHATTLGI